MRRYFFYYCLFLPIVAVAQPFIKGRCIDGFKQSVPFPSVLLYNNSSKQIVSFTIGDAFGYFSLKIDSTEKTLQLKITAVSFADTVIDLRKLDPRLGNGPIIMRSIERNLKEVIVHGDRSIIEKGDTVSMKAKAFAAGDEKVLEDLLKRLPGVDVATDGSIRVNGKEIEKIMVEGDDFFDKGYKLLSKNMPPNVVDKVEIIQQYESQKLRKGLKESDKVALNLKLTDDAKRKWFGNIDIASNPSQLQYYAGRTNLMNFRKKFKTYILNAANSVGDNIDISVVDQIGEVKEEAGSEVEQLRLLHPSVAFAPNQIPLPSKKYLFNRTFIQSGNIIFRPFETTRIRVGINRISDQLESQQFVHESISLVDTSFTNRESDFIRRSPETYLSKLNWQTDIDSITSISMDINYLYSKNKEQSVTFFNNNSLKENNTYNQTFLSYKASFVKRISQQKLVQISFFGNQQKLPVFYTNTPFLSADFFSAPANSSSAQKVKNRVGDNNFTFSYTNRLRNTLVVEIYTGYNQQSNELQSTLQFKTNDTIITAGSAFEGFVSLNQQRLFSKVSLNKKWKQISIMPSLEGTYIHQHYQGLSITSWHNFFLNPALSIGFQPNKKHKLLAVVGSSSSAPNFELVQPIYLMNGFRGFQRGSNTIQSVQQTTKLLSYTIGNWAERFFVNIFYFDMLEHQFLGTNSNVSPNIIFTEKIWLQNKQTQSINGSIDLFLNHINSNVKLTTQLSNADFFNVVNGSNIRKVRSRSLTMGLEVKSVFKGIYNHHLGLKKIISSNRTELTRKFVYHSGFMDFYFRPKKIGTFKFKNEFFQFPKETVDKNFLIFSDIGWSKSLIDSKLTIGISLQNLLNQTQFANIAVSDISISTSTTNLFPRMLLMNIACRF